ALNQELSGVFRTATTAQWIEKLNAAGVPSGPILTVDQVWADPQVKHLGIAAPVRHHALGEIRVIRQAATLSRTPAELMHALPPIGANNAEILEALGYTAEQIAALRDGGVI
ncbi:MAG: CoA transferase, partial [Quisquiliibacterium sp.]